MRLNKTRLTRFTITAALALASILTFASAALGAPDVVDPQWATTGSGFTHKNAMAKAIQIAANRSGTNWVDPIAVDRAIYPDTVFKDNIDHNANWWGSYPSYYNKNWGSRFGNPQGKVQSYYNEVVKDLRAGDRVGASKAMGYLSHYLIDINGPLHTQESKTEDNALHTNLESDASKSSYGSYISDNGYQYYGGHSSPSALTVANANSSHDYYSSLVNTYASHGFNSTVRDIEGHNFNRGVNSIADLIQSAQADADAVTAVIDSISPSACTTGTPIKFTGHGTDPMGHNIAETRWRSSRDGALSTGSVFTTSTLTMGIHNIHFIVRCDGPKWSAETFRPIVIGAENTKPRAVYRFFNMHTGVHFYTASEQEMLTVRNTLASTYNLEGVAYALDTSSTVNTAPLHRFFDRTKGVHFMTADENERATIVNTLGDKFSYDGIVAYVAKTPTDSSPIYRFYNFKKDVHFYTASLAERDMVIAKLGETYRYEGLSYYYDPPW